VGWTYHVTNRGNERRTLFAEDDHYLTFLRLLTIGKRRCPIKIYGVCAMPNHFHALARSEAPGALSTYFHWVEGCYSRDVRTRTRTAGYGHVFQSRFWSDGIQDTCHFLNVLRYIEANPVEARLVSRAEDWRWSSLSMRSREARQLLDPLPFTLPENWSALVNDEPDPFVVF
jgi:putative transposase